MTIEKQLEKLIDISEKGLELLARLATKEGVGGSYAKERKQEVAAAAGNRPRGETALKPELKVKEPEKVPEPDFLDDGPAPEPVKEVTIDDVRKALVAFRTAKIAELGDAKGKELVMKLLSDHGNKATVLPGTKAALLPDGSPHPGALKQEYFAAVLAALTK